METNGKIGDADYCFTNTKVVKDLIAGMPIQVGLKFLDGLPHIKLVRFVSKIVPRSMNLGPIVARCCT